MQTIKVPELAWHCPRDLSLSLPDHWQVETLNMSGYDRPELTPEAILNSLQNPIGCPSLRALAKGKKEVAIVFDDLTRVTRAAKIVPHVLHELIAAGIPENNIRFICGSGLHAALNRTDLVKKLGEEVVSRFRVFNHNPLGECIFVGTTRTFQTRVSLNAEYLKCDLKIVIGSCVPHAAAGFGGGAKLLLPGVASFDTISQHHHAAKAQLVPTGPSDHPTRGMGITENNTFRQDIDEAAGLAGIDFLINTTINLMGESVAIFAGDWRLAYQAAVNDARKNYRTEKTSDNDIVISNSYAKASEAMISLGTGASLVSPKGGDVVVIANAPEGQVTHYLMGVFGKTTFAPQFSPFRIPPQVNRVYMLTEYPHPGSSWLTEDEKIVNYNNWDTLLQDLQTRHGPGSKVAVIPDATNQFFVEKSG
jgi:nickel-dependent lactate racemase